MGKPPFFNLDLPKSRPTYVVRSLRRPSCPSPLHRMRTASPTHPPLPVGPSAEQGTKCCPTHGVRKFRRPPCPSSLRRMGPVSPTHPDPLPVGPSAGAGGKASCSTWKRRKGQLSSLVFGLGFNVKKERPGHPRGSRRVVASHGPCFQRRAGRRAKRQHRDNIRAPPRYIA